MSQEKFMRMDDDIVRQAALRRHRRTHGGSREIDGAGTFQESLSGASSPRPPHYDDILMQEPENTPSGQATRYNRDLLIPQQVRRRVFANRSANNIQQNDASSFCSLSLPFIPCKLKTREVKALINTCVMSSIINRHLFQNVFSIDPNRPIQFPDVACGVPITIESKVVQFDFHIRGDIPDIVLGLDFLTHNKCILDLGSRTFTIGDYDAVTTQLINDRDLPLKYRHSGNLAASI